MKNIVHLPKPVRANPRVKLKKFLFTAPDIDPQITTEFWQLIIMLSKEHSSRFYALCQTLLPLNSIETFPQFVIPEDKLEDLVNFFGSSARSVCNHPTSLNLASWLAYTFSLKYS